MEAITRGFLGGKTIEQIATEMHSTYPTVRFALRSRGVQTDMRKSSRNAGYRAALCDIERLAVSTENDALTREVRALVKRLRQSVKDERFSETCP